MSELAYKIIDADNHYYEPDDCFTRHIEAKYKHKTIRVDRSSADGFGRPYVADERLNFFSVGVGDFVGNPGAMKAFFKGETEEGGAVNASGGPAKDRAEFVSKAPRLKLMDEQGVEAAIMIPTMGVGCEYQLRRYPELLTPSLRAFNRWLEEDWGYGQDGRIFSTPMVSLADLNGAMGELERLLQQGAKLVVVNTGPVNDKSPADQYFDPFWARAEEAGIKIVFHIGATPFCEMYGTHWGETPNPPSHRFSAFQSYLGIGARPICDTIAALIFHNLFDRFPKLQCLIIEHGAAWVKQLLNTLDKTWRMGDHKTRWMNGKPSLQPSDVFRRNFWIVPFFEDDITELVATIGASQVLNGSDFPHPEGLAWPAEFAEELTQLSAAQSRMIMRDNGAGLLGITT
ncbi:MAG: amidohydrolase family protein [Pseudomonadales bacterium]